MDFYLASTFTICILSPRFLKLTRPPCQFETDWQHLDIFNTISEERTRSRTGGGTSVQGDVWLSRALRLWVVARNLLRLRLWNLHTVLNATVRGRGGNQQRLLRRGGGRWQVQGSNLLSHQLLLDLVNEDQVIQLKGLTGHAQQKTAALCECHSCHQNILQDRKH